MTTYRISSQHFVAAVIVSGDLVMQSAPILHWAVGKDWPHVRDYIERKGWTIEPLPDVHTKWIDTDEASYELLWHGKRCQRITRHVDGYEPEDVRYSDLPDDVKELIE